jgi:23S rRNA pseudoU1915 N3-methylase RlmH
LHPEEKIFPIASLLGSILQDDRKEYTKQIAIWYKQNFAQIDTFIRNKMTAVAKNQQKQKSLKKSEQEINKQLLGNTKGRNGAMKIAPNSDNILSADDTASENI